MNFSENTISYFGISRTDFDRVGYIVMDYHDESLSSLRGMLRGIFGISITDGHFRAMYFHLGASLAAKESDNFKVNVMNLCQRVN